MNILLIDKTKFLYKEIKSIGYPVINFNIKILRKIIEQKQKYNFNKDKIIYEIFTNRFKQQIKKELRPTSIKPTIYVTTQDIEFYNHFDTQIYINTEVDLIKMFKYKSFIKHLDIELTKIQIISIIKNKK